MGFSLGGFGRILGGIGSIAAAPFTGGASLAALPGVLSGAGSIAGGIGEMAAGASKNRQQGRADEARILIDADRGILDRDRLRQQGVLDQAALEQQGAFGEAGLDLQRRGFQESAPNNRLDQAGRADFIQNLPGALSRGPSINTVGGRPFASFGMQARDFAPSQQTQDLAGLVRQRAFDAQSAGDQFDPLNLPQINLPEISEPPKLPESTGVDTFLNTTAGIGGILGGIGQSVDEIQARRERNKRRQDEFDEDLGGVGA